jgi:hypothetical protein
MCWRLSFLNAAELPFQRSALHSTANYGGDEERFWRLKLYSCWPTVHAALRNVTEIFNVRNIDVPNFTDKLTNFSSRERVKIAVPTCRHS